MECDSNDAGAVDPFHTHKYFFIGAPLSRLYNLKKSKWLHFAINWIIPLMHPFDVSVLPPRMIIPLLKGQVGGAAPKGGWCLFAVRS